MTHASALQYLTLLYVSALADRQTPATVAGIAKQSRLNNSNRSTTGLLIFDGSSFAQLLQGPDSVITSMLGRLRTDKRHEDMEVLLFETTQPPLRFPTWDLGYLLVQEEDEGIRNLRGLNGRAARRGFEAMLPMVDLGIASMVPALHVWRPPLPRLGAP